MTRFVVNDSIVRATSQEYAMWIYRYFNPGVLILKCYWIDADY